MFTNKTKQKHVNKKLRKMIEIWELVMSHLKTNKYLKDFLIFSINSIFTLNKVVFLFFLGGGTPSRAQRWLPALSVGVAQRMAQRHGLNPSLSMQSMYSS